ncbi:MAG: amidophosphoribosyltransferase [Elusimicrobiota bacterium]
MCGIFGISDNEESAKLSYVALFTLQHRGQESAGIASVKNGKLSYYNSMGLVNEIFNPSVLASLSGKSAIGHVRYSTAGSSSVNNSQPLYFNCKYGEIAVAHNGNIVNAAHIKENLAKSGAIFQSDTDSEAIIHLISRSGKKNFFEAALEQLPKLKGAYSFLFLNKDALMAARDPYGFRPLVLAKKDSSFIFTSETCAAEVIGAEIIREIEPGEAAIVKNGKISFFRFSPIKKYSRCIFEQVYFARPDSVVCGHTVQSARYLIGKYLFEEMKGVKADIVSGVPDSGSAYALGFSAASKIPYVPVFMRNHYAGRSFIQPDQKMREFTAHLKLAPIKDAIKGKEIVLIDDSLVRGTTSLKIIKSLKNAGAKKIIMAVASPPIISPCFYGIDTPTKEELIAVRLKEKDKIRKFIGADELHYLSLDNLIKACGLGDKNFCKACFDGKYPVK